VPPRHLVVEDLLTQLLRRYTLTVRRIIRCWRTPRQNLTIRIFETVGSTAAPPSVHPVLKLQSWCVFVLIQTKRWIDRRCPYLDRQIIRCYCLSLLCLFHLSGATRKHTVGSCDGLCKLSFLHAVYQVHRHLHQWYRRFIRRYQFPSFSSVVLTLEK
jgi:hypothetical protein